MIIRLLRKNKMVVLKIKLIFCTKLQSLRHLQTEYKGLFKRNAFVILFLIGTVCQ